MADPVYRYRTKERASYIAPGDMIQSASHGGFHEVARLAHNGDRIHVIHTEPNRVSILRPDDRIDLLRPDELPHYLRKEETDG